MKFNLELATKCMQIRKKSGVTLRAFADSLGLKIEDIKEFENNLKSIPTKVLVEYSKLKKELENEKNNI